LDLSLKKFYKNKRVLITGHTGFKGSWLSIWLKYLQANVCGVSLKNPYKYANYNLCGLEKKIKNYFFDLNDYKYLLKVINNFKPDIIFHLAAQSLVLDGIKNPSYTFNNNINTTINILEILKNFQNISSTVIVTSDKVYEPSVKNMKEEDRLGGIDPYSASKSCCEIILNSYRNSFDSKSLRFLASARAGNVIGGGDVSENRLVPDIYKAIQNKISLTIRNPNHIRPWQHVLDPLNGYLILAMKNYKNGLFSSEWNFGPNLNRKKKVIDIANDFKNINKNLKIKILKNFKKNESTVLNLNSNKAKKILNWKSQINHKEMIELTNNEYFLKGCEESFYDQRIEHIKKYFHTK